MGITLAFWLIWGLLIGLLALGANLGKVFPERSLRDHRLITLGLSVGGALIGGVIGTLIFGVAVSTPLAIALSALTTSVPVVRSRWPRAS